MQDHYQDQIQAQDLPILRAISLGLRVMGSELHWSIIRRLRNWEIRQLHNRLQREYQELGRLNRNQEQDQASQNLEQDMQLCRQQIDFLERELEYLQQELNRSRQEMLEQRRSKWAV
ncbi:MAG: hypothetical protein ACLFMQ_00940 [Desulfohalobiaceae bacterium]